MQVFTVIVSKPHADFPGDNSLVLWGEGVDPVEVGNRVLAEWRETLARTYAEDNIDPPNPQDFQVLGVFEGRLHNRYATEYWTRRGKEMRLGENDDVLATARALFEAQLEQPRQEIAA